VDEKKQVKRRNSTIKYKRGDCIDCPKSKNPQYLYAKGRCKFHYDLNRSKERREKKKTQQADTGVLRGELELFEKLWAERPRVSFLTGEPIKISRSSKFWYNIFAHVLSKKKYPQFRYEEWNIVFLTPDEHYSFDFRTEDKQEELHPECNWVKLREYREQMKEENLC
jgi:hypothetical protein